MTSLAQALLFVVSVNEVYFAIFFLSLQQVLEAQRRHQKEKSGIIPTSPTPYTYNKVSYETVYMSRSLKHIVLAFFSLHRCACCKCSL